VSFWRRKVIEFALDHETEGHIDAQRSWIGREPDNPVPFRNLAQLYRLQGRQEEALALLLEAVRLDVCYAPAHLELAELYAVRGDMQAAWRHARLAERNGDSRAVELLTRHSVAEL